MSEQQATLFFSDPGPSVRHVTDEGQKYCFFRPGSVDVANAPSIDMIKCWFETEIESIWNKMEGLGGYVCSGGFISIYNG